MDNNTSLEIIEALQKTVEQMKIDDIEDCPDSAFEYFQCQCCGEEKIKAGSLIYNEYLLCNECVLLAETGLTLKKIENIEELIDSMSDKRFENLYSSLFDKTENLNN